MWPQSVLVAAGSWSRIFFFNVLWIIYNKKNAHADNQQWNLHKTADDKKKQAGVSTMEHSWARTHRDAEGDSWGEWSQDASSVRAPCGCAPTARFSDIFTNAPGPAVSWNTAPSVTSLFVSFVLSPATNEECIWDKWVFHLRNDQNRGDNFDNLVDSRIQKYLAICDSRLICFV